MGPLLFLIYINDLPSNVSPGTTVWLFADDCLVYCGITSEEGPTNPPEGPCCPPGLGREMGHEIQPEVVQHTIRISRRRPRDRFYTMYGEILQEAQEAKYLGVTINNNLKWEKHISAKTSRVNSTLHFISRTLPHCPRTPDNLPTSPSLDLPWNTAAQSGACTMEIKIQTAWK